MSNELSFDPFTTEGLLAFSDLERDPSQPWHGFQLDTKLRIGLLKLAETVDIQLDSLRTECLDLSLDDVPILEDDISQTSTPALQDDHDISKAGSPPAFVEHDDIWNHLDIWQPKEDNRLISWDSFLDSAHEPAKSIYLSEAGPQVFDALLRKIKTQPDSTKVTKYAKHDIFTRALFDVGLGRESAFFKWNSASGTFNTTRNGFTISGISQEMLEQITHTFISHGAKYRLLTRFGSTKACRGPFAIAFSGAMQDVLDAIERFIGEKLKGAITLLKLQDIFHKPSSVVDLLYTLMETFVKSADNDTLVQDLIMSTQNEAAQNIELEPIIGQLMDRIMQPGLQAVEAKIGLSVIESSDCNSIVAAIRKSLPSQTSQLLDSTDISLQLLRNVAPRQLSRFRLLAQNKLEFCLSWSDIGQRQELADKYEQAVSHALLHDDDRGESFDAKFQYQRLTQGESAEHETENAFSFESDLFLRENLDMNASSNSSSNCVANMAFLTLTSASLPSSWLALSLQQALELSLQPMLLAQHRLLSYMACQSVITNNNLLVHLQSLYRFQLMNDGPFTSRLSLSLFNSDQGNTETRLRTNMASGLRLQNRDTWPPASSELRLVLMGILSDSLSNVRDERISEAISFAIRDLTDEELERCRDINSIHALDFLCLRYKTSSSALESIITAKALKKYDDIFMYLLRLLRAKDLAQYLLRQTCARNLSDAYSSSERRFRRNIQHFTTALANYSHNIVISTHWHQFETKMQAIQECLNKKDYNGTLKLATSLEHLREMHEQTLSDISHGLLLGKKQKAARAIIEDIFGIILQYAASDSTMQRHDREHYNASSQDTTKRQQDFDRKVKNLLEYLRSGSSQQSNPDSASEMMEQLLLSLDYAGYYARK